jgi:class 3 adenylate cyclase
MTRLTARLLAANGGRAREERRTVSVLFADIVGYTRLAGRLDPEDVRALQNEYFARVAQVIRRCGGVVEKYVGDAVLALFGAPRSDGYDAYRAVRAGLAIQEALAGLSLADGSVVQVRIGVATGEALVDLAAVHDGGQALVSGDVVNVAARVQAHADPGTVAVTATTCRATAALVCYQRLPAIRAAGKPVAIDVWRACGPAPYLAAGYLDGGAPPLVGRDAELSTVVNSLTRVSRERVLEVVSVVGPVGMGKSRLVHESVRRVRATGEQLLCWVGHCSPCEGGRYEALAEMIRAHAGVRVSDDPATARHRLAAAVEGLVPADELPHVLDALAILLDPPKTGTGQPSPDAAERVWRRLLLAAAARQPLVLVVEDLHHADAAMKGFLRDLCVAAAAAPRPLALALVVTHPPELSDALGVPAGGRGQTVLLRPLDVPETRRLLRLLLDRAGQPATHLERLLPLAAGNPRFAEEYVQALAERGTRAAKSTDGVAAAPECVHRIVSARIDQLDEPDRAVLQAAAVLGDVVRPDALAALLNTDRADAHWALRRLERRDLLVRRESAAVTGEPEYTFGHVAVRQVGYARLPRAVRVDHHRKAAEWLHTIAVTGQSDADEERARHWLTAFDLARALHRDAEPYLVAARGALAAAAHDAWRRGATRRARSLAHRALRLRPDASDSADRAYRHAPAVALTNT